MKTPSSPRLLAACGFAAAFLLLLTACSTSKRSFQPQQPVALTFSADSAYAFCAAQCAFGPRVMNSEAHERCARWIADQFRRYGYQVDLQQPTLRAYDGTALSATNIIARPQPAAASPQRPRILLCAHWDSRPWADNDPDSTNWRKPVMGANDGASGVAVMLEVARLLQQNDSARVAVDFLCLDAEDYGVPQWSDMADSDSWALGAQYFAANPAPLRPADYQYAILLDMVGGQGARFYRELFSLQHARSVVEKVWQAAAVAGYGSLFPNRDGGYITDDHVPLNEVAHIPTIDIINHYPDCPESSFGPVWHTVSDDLAHIDRNSLQAVGQTLIQLIYSE